MANLIERDKAIDALKKISFSHWFECGEYLSEDTCEIEIINSNKAQKAIEELPSAQPDNKINLCDSCKHTYPVCPSKAEDVIWGNGTGNNNICACSKYEPHAQPEITDVQAIEHLQDTGWMQNHDHEMYMMGRRDALGDDSGSYDSLIPAEYKLDEWCTDCKEYDSEKHCCPRFNRVIRTAMEDAKPEQRWIPVSERLPEEDEDVLVTVFFHGLTQKHTTGWNDHIKPKYYVDIASQIDGEWTSYSDEYKVAKSRHEVIAWMPLPEPFREKQDGQDA